MKTDQLGEALRRAISMPQPKNAGISDAGGAMTARTDSVNLGAVG